MPERVGVERETARISAVDGTQFGQCEPCSAYNQPFWSGAQHTASVESRRIEPSPQCFQRDLYSMGRHDKLREFRHSLGVKARFKLLQSALEDRRSSLELLGYDDYKSYLMSAQWGRIRRRVYARAGGKCEGCGERPPANVHHWSYSIKTLQGKKLQNLEAVCKECHDQFHEEPAQGVKTGRQMTAKQLANKAFGDLVRSGGLVAQPVDMTPRLVRRTA